MQHNNNKIDGYFKNADLILKGHRNHYDGLCDVSIPSTINNNTPQQNLQVNAIIRTQPYPMGSRKRKKRDRLPLRAYLVRALRILG